MTIDERDAAVAGVISYQELGSDIAVADLDGDGHADYLAGARYDDSAMTNAGAWYGWYGPLNGPMRTTDDADLVVLGDEQELQLGDSPLPVGDLDGDGRDDLVFTSRNATIGGASAGAAWLFYGPLSGSLRLADAETDGALIVGDPGSYLGYHAAMGEGLAYPGSTELLLGAYRAGWDGGTSNGGALYLFGDF